MAKRGRKPKQAVTVGGPAGMTGGDGESISGYFRKVFAERPDLLKSRSNDELLARWLHDHPGAKEVPPRVKTNLANIKSVLRKQLRKRGRRNAQARAALGAAPAAARVRVIPLGLEALEIQIDDALTLARTLDREGLERVINHLRTARNEVVWKLGQPE